MGRRREEEVRWRGGETGRWRDRDESGQVSLVMSFIKDMTVW